MEKETRGFPQQENSYDVILIGGGIIGLAIAYEAAQQGAKVALLERNQFAKGTTCAAAGMLAPTAERFEHPSLHAFAVDSLQLYQAWAEKIWEDTGIDPELRLRGVIIPSKEIPSIERDHISHRTTNSPALYPPLTSHPTWFDKNKLRERNLELGDSIVGAAYLANEGHISPTKLSEALLEAARRAGAHCLEHEEAKELMLKDGRITGVRTSITTYTANQVVLCSGLDSEQLARSVGVHLPHYSVKGELLVLRSKASFETVIYGEGVYIVPKSQQRIYIGATSMSDQYDRYVQAGSIMNLLEQACAYLPELRSAYWEQAWAGLRPCTPDRLPYIGPFPGVRGLWAASGHYRNGVLLAPATASVLVDWMNSGSMPWAYLNDFRVERMLQGSTNFVG